MPLSDMTVRTLAPPEHGQRTIWDDVVPGFGCRVSQGGTKTFVVVHGRNRQRTTIGRYPILSLAQARQRAKEILAESVLGMTRKPSHIPFSEAVEIFLATHSARPATIKEYRRLLHKHFMPKLRHDMVERITTHQLTRILDKLTDRPSELRHAFKTAAALFMWIEGRRWIERTPFHGLKTPKPAPRRTRRLNDAELAIVLRKAMEWPSQLGEIIQLLILLGQRRGEIGGLRASYVDRVARTITWPGDVVKNGITHTVPYGDWAESILAQVPNDGDLYFVARGSDDKSYCGWSKTVIAFVKACGIPHFTLHDLRRSFASGMQRIAVPVEITETLLNHVSGSFDGIVGVYQQYEYVDECRDAINRWERHLISILDATKVAA